jgi:hypothetical protein
MSAAPQHRRRPRCRICQAELPWRRSLMVISHRVFCSTHARQYHARQRQGVSTEELETRWSDTLDNWRERPRALDKECGRLWRWSLFSYLFFDQRVEGWVLFRRSSSHWGWQHPEYRGPDWVAVNPETGDIRRFVSVWEEDVLEDLRGIRPAPHQQELAPYWGRRLPPGFLRRFTQPSLYTRQTVAALLATALFPIYGFVGQPSGLAVCGVGGTSRGFRRSGIHFNFSSPHYPRVREAVCLASSDVCYSGRVIRRPEDIKPWMFLHAGLSEAEQAQAGDPAIRSVAFSIAQVSFAGEMYCWTQPFPFCWFELTSEETRITGSAVGPSEEQVLHLLQGMVVLNEQAGLVSQYQRELDEERARRLGERP